MIKYKWLMMANKNKKMANKILLFTILAILFIKNIIL